MGPYLLVQQVNVKLPTRDHGYPKLGAELIMQLAQCAHEQLPVRCNRLVACLGWRVRPQSCAKVMLGSCTTSHRSQLIRRSSEPFHCMCAGSMAGCGPCLAHVMA